MDEDHSRRSVLKRAGALTAAASVPVAGVAADESSGTGTLDITVYEEKVEDGEIVTEPVGDIDVYDTTDGGIYSYQGGEADYLGETGDDGTLQSEIDAGERELTVRIKWTRYYAGKDEGIPVQISPGETTEFEYDFLPSLAWIAATYQTEYGKAIYVTGESEYLGNWQEAKKLSPDEDGNYWEWNERLPAGAEFKFVRADWSDDEWISTEGVDWEVGSNRVLEGGYGYPGSYVKDTPEF